MSHHKENSKSLKSTTAVKEEPNGRVDAPREKAARLPPYSNNNQDKERHELPRCPCLGRVWSLYFHNLLDSAYPVGIFADMAGQLGKTTEHPKSKSTQPKSVSWWNTLYFDRKFSHKCISFKIQEFHAIIVTFSYNRKLTLGGQGPFRIYEISVPSVGVKEGISCVFSRAKWR